MMERIVKYITPISKPNGQRGDKEIYWIRDVDGLRKKPSTSELLDWIKALSLAE
jgi:hypothetical protein